MAAIRRVTGDALKARDALWLAWREDGWGADEIAEQAGVSRQLVNRRLRIAEATRAETRSSPPEPAPRPPAPWWLELVPFFPIGPFTPSSECPHRGPIAEGSLLCCMVCSASGMDGHRALRRDPATDPRPEPPPAASAAPTPTSTAPAPKPESRRERRRRTFGGRPVEPRPC
jgi:hypothetical protein